MDRERYSRQMLFAPIGEEGQEKLKNSAVLIVGCGALGTVAANQLVRAGVGHVRIVDRDFVETSNLQRQMLFTEEDAAHMMPKAIAAKSRLEEMNSGVEIEGIVTDVNAGSIENLLENMDLVVDGTDNFSTRFLLNDACYKHGLPYMYGGAVSSRGMSASFIPGETPCLRCLLGSGYDSSGDTCDTIGVISPIVDIIASIETAEALKWLTGRKDKMRRSLLQMDVWSFQTQEITFKSPRPDCLTCGTKEYPDLQQARADEAVSMCGRDSVQIHSRTSFDLNQLAEQLQAVLNVEVTPFLLRVEISSDERLVVFSDGRVLVQGTDDISRAKTLVARYIGS
ncbi:ThiF family adenylyltransferase [Salsuginibacillus kocurii]|uniref:ThiF family adenylyltransferase n=1 Tax=Salsuginibacillus kocurii TaxID=427078 RepID=UPI00037BFA04|nr:ThiF family adenylyltransferase [Salsuginibacillus kocurii]